MTRPVNYLIRMLLFMLAMVVVAVLLSGALAVAFESNPLLNSLILLVLLLGVAWNMRQVLRLTPEVRWVETFQHSRARLAGLPSPVLLAPMASMMSQRSAKGVDRFTLSAPAMRSLLDSLANRLDESREMSRYMTGLLIFLGLLGTFWGLLLTVASVAAVINGMSVGSGDINVLFDQLKGGLARPLQGMSTAFSSSMFGLSGALVLGFLDLTAGQAQNRFFNELEEWLAGLTRLSSGVLGGEGEASVPVYVQALLEQTAENMESLQRVLVRSEEGRLQANQATAALSDKIGQLSDSMRASQQLMLRIAEAQSALAPALHRLGERGGDDAVRGHLRNIEAALGRLAGELESGRAQTVGEVRNDIRVLTRTVAGLASRPA